MMKDNRSSSQAPPGQATGIERWGWYSIAVNVVLAAINLGIALASGSLAVEAEMVHNLVDLLSAIGVLIGLRLSTRKSKEFPYGLYKLENVVAVALAVMTFITAYEIAHDALLETARQATVNAWMLAGVVVATIIPLTFSHFELRAGREANSPALVANAREYRAHVFTTGVVFAALVGQWLNFPLDRVAALVIVVAIGKTGWELLADGMRVLLDASLDAGTLLEIREVILAEPAVSALKWVTGRSAGRFRFVEAEVALRVHDLEKAEAATRRIEAEIRQAVPHVERVLLHAEPTERTHLRYAVPLADPVGTISDHFGEAPYFALVRVRLADGAVEERQVVANPYREEERAKGIQVAEWLVAQKADVVLLKESLKGKGPLYVFGDAGIELHQTTAGTLDHAIAAQLHGFALTGDVEADLLSITAVHPMREESVGKLLAQAQADWSTVRRLVAQGQLVMVEYGGQKFYLRKLGR
jgi:cation diffusion facilitator family transporter